MVRRKWSGWKQSGRSPWLVVAVVVLAANAAQANYTVQYTGEVENIQVSFNPTETPQVPTAYGVNVGTPVTVTVVIDPNAPQMGLFFDGAVVEMVIDMAGQSWEMDPVPPTTTQLNVIDNNVLPAGNLVGANNFGVAGPAFVAPFDAYPFIAFSLSAPASGLPNGSMPSPSTMLGLIGLPGEDTAELRFQRPNPMGGNFIEVVNINLNAATVPVPALGGFGVSALVCGLTLVGGFVARRVTRT